MPWRSYWVNQKYTKRDGTVSIYKVKNKQWIKSNSPYKPRKRGLGKQLIWSSRFGFLDSYNRKEQQELRCPSGYTISQCFNVMRKLWYGYHKSRCDERNLGRMKKYASAIQKVQKDMGIATTSFPHLGLYGDVLILNNKHGEQIAFEDHSALKKQQQQQEEYEKGEIERAENAKKIQETLQIPDREKGQELLTFSDDVYSHKFYDDLDDNEDDEERPPVPILLKPDKDKGQSILIITDDIPFLSNPKSHHRK